MKKKEPMPRLSLRCDEETAALVNRIAATRNATTSEVLRDLVQAGMEKQQGEEVADQLQGIRAVVKETVKPYMERLAAINAKASQMTAAAFFLEIYVCDLVLPPDDHQRIADMAIKAHQLGSEFTKVNNTSLDSLIYQLISALDSSSPVIEYDKTDSTSTGTPSSGVDKLFRQFITSRD